MDASLATRWAAVNQWHVKPEMQKDFDIYNCQVWPGTQVMEANKQGEIEFNDQGNMIWFKINWIDTPVVCYRAPSISLSFRRIRGMAEGYVLIRKFNPRGKMGE